MSENLTPEQDDIEAHRQEVRREFTDQAGRGRMFPPVDGGDDDVEAHMPRIPFGQRESVDEDEDVRAHMPLRPLDGGAGDAVSQATRRVDGGAADDVEAHGVKQVDGDDGDDVEAHGVKQVDGGDDAERDARHL